MTKAPSKVIQFSRLDAVKHQLEMAVRARAQYDDLISAMTLAGAAERVLSDLQPKLRMFGKESYSIKTFCETYVKADRRKVTTKKIRSAYDYLRHADRLHTRNKELQIDTEWVDLYLMTAIKEFERVSKAHAPILLAFQAWAPIIDPKWELLCLIPEAKDRTFVDWVRNLTPAELFDKIHKHFESKSQIPNP